MFINELNITMINPLHVNIDNIFLGKIAIFLQNINEKSGMVSIFADLLNVYLSRGYLDSHNCFCIHYVVVLVLAYVQWAYEEYPALYR